ncbi:MAG: hypothetical protein PHR43_04960 [Dehalococcoidales bacterium]|nr:hypothetical protein [Dehalococcoidales bacterium]
MTSEERIKALEEEFQQAKEDIRQILMDIRTYLMEAQSPIPNDLERAEARAEASAKAADDKGGKA